MNANRPGAGGSADDSFSQLFDAWMSAFGVPRSDGDQRSATGTPEDLFRAWASMFAPGFLSATDRKSTADPFSQVWGQAFDTFVSWAEMWAPFVGTETFKTPPTRPPERPDRFAVLAAQGYGLCLASYLRYLRRAADVWGEYCQTAAGQVNDVTKDRSPQDRAAFDERVAKLREAGERFVQEARSEARAVQQQLLELAREAVNADDKQDEPRRYAKAKP